MAKIKFDQDTEKLFEAGVSECVLYVWNATGGTDQKGAYRTGVCWNGITNITQSPSGGESNKQYADNIPYADLRSAEEFGGTINAFTYPDAFEECQGNKVVNGVAIGQQTKTRFGLVYKTKIGNDADGLDYGYKVHIIYGCTINPSERGYDTINDNPEAMEMSWEFTTLPVTFEYSNESRTTSSLEFKVTKNTPPATKTKIEALLDNLYGKDPTTEGGTDGLDPTLKMPNEILTALA